MADKKDNGERIEYQVYSPLAGRTVSFSIDPTKPLTAAVQEELMDMTDGLDLPLDEREEIVRKTTEYALKKCPGLAKVPADMKSTAAD